MPDDVRERSWWDPHPMAEDTAGRWRIGPLSLYAHRTRHEWRLSHSQSGDPLDGSFEQELPFPPADIPELEDSIRFGFVRSPDSLRLRPVLADRNVVLRPRSTLYIPPEESVSVFVSTPLWLQIAFGDKQPPMHEVPTFRPSDTWFGPTTLEGELCYASRTHPHLSLDELKRRPHRARTVVHVKNRAKDPLRLERLNVPVRHLSLFASSDRAFWTEPVTLTRESDGDLAAMRIGEGPPREAVGAVKLADPRAPAETNVVVRAFEAFFKEKDR